MKKQNLKSLAIKKNTISNFNEKEANSGGLGTTLAGAAAGAVTEVGKLETRCISCNVNYTCGNPCGFNIYNDSMTCSQMPG